MGVPEFGSIMLILTLKRAIYKIKKRREHNGTIYPYKYGTFSIDAIREKFYLSFLRIGEEGYSLIDYEWTALEVGIIEYPTKPLDFVKLYPILIKYLRQDQTEDTHVGKGLPALPDHLEKQVLKGFAELSRFSILSGGPVVDLVQEMLSLCGDFDSSYPKILTGIEDAVFTGDEKQFNFLIKKVHNK